MGSDLWVTVARVVVHLKAATNDEPRFRSRTTLDTEWRKVSIATHLLT